MQSKWTSRKLWMSIVTVAGTLIMTYLGKQELTDQVLTEATKILDAILEIVQLVVPATVTIAYVVSEAKVDAARAGNGSAPK